MVALTADRNTPEAIGDLREGEAARFLDRLDAQRPIAIAAGEHHPG